MLNAPLHPDRAELSYQKLVADIYPRLAQLVIQRYQSYARKTLQDVYNLDQDFLRVEPDTVEFTAAYRAEIITILEDPQLLSSLVRLFVISTLEFTYANNQFVHANRQKERQLEKLYRSYLLNMKAILEAESEPDAIRDRLKELIAGHFEDLKRNLANYLDQDDERVLEGNMLFNQVVCRQYMAILSALVPGGSFYYSPGLPFIEELLPSERYQVTRRKVSGTRRDQSGNNDLGNEDLYTTQVMRR